MNRNQQRLSSINLQRAITIAVLLFLIIFFTLAFDVIQAKIKDSKRKTDLNQIKKALIVYQLQHNKFPKVQEDDVNGWDLSYYNGQTSKFLNILLKEKIIDKILKDPVNSGEYYYRYKKFPAGSFGCEKSFYILQAINFEYNNKDHGYGECPERNFVEEIPNGYTIQMFE